MWFKLYSFVLLLIPGILHSQIKTEIINELVKLKDTNATGYYLGKMDINPFSPVLEAHFSIQDTSYIIINITDTLGKKILTLFENILSKGLYEIKLTELNTHGGLLKRGIYFLTLEAKYPYLNKTDNNRSIYFYSRAKFLFL